MMPFSPPTHSRMDGNEIGKSKLSCGSCPDIRMERANISCFTQCPMIARPFRSRMFIILTRHGHANNARSVRSLDFRTADSLGRKITPKPLLILLLARQKDFCRFKSVADYNRTFTLKSFKKVPIRRRARHKGAVSVIVGYTPFGFYRMAIFVGQNRLKETVSIVDTMIKDQNDGLVRILAQGVFPRLPPDPCFPSR